MPGIPPHWCALTLVVAFGDYVHPIIPSLCIMGYCNCQIISIPVRFSIYRETPSPRRMYIVAMTRQTRWLCDRGSIAFTSFPAPSRNHRINQKTPCRGSLLPILTFSFYTTDLYSLSEHMGTYNKVEGETCNTAKTMCSPLCCEKLVWLLL